MDAIFVNNAMIMETKAGNNGRSSDQTRTTAASLNHMTVIEDSHEYQYTGKPIYQSNNSKSFDQTANIDIFINREGKTFDQTSSIAPTKIVDEDADCLLGILLMQDKLRFIKQQRLRKRN